MSKNPMQELKKIDIHMGGQVYNIVERGKSDSCANLRNKFSGNMKYDVRLGDILMAISKCPGIVRPYGHKVERKTRLNHYGRK